MPTSDIDYQRDYEAMTQWASSRRVADAAFAGSSGNPTMALLSTASLVAGWADERA